MNNMQREDLAARVLARSNADQTEVLVTSSDSALTRFAQGISNQNVAAQDGTISVRAIVGNRTGVAATNRMDERSLDRTVSRAIKMASFAPADPMQPQLPSAVPKNASPENAFFSSTADTTPTLRAHAAGEMLAQAEQAGFWCSGYVSTSSSGITVANSSGALASFDETDSRANVTVTAANSTGFAEWYSRDFSALDGAAIGLRAVEKAASAANPVSVDPGEWAVILEPAAFGELLTYVVSHFSAQSFSEGSSFFSSRLGETFFGESLTICDDRLHPLFSGMPFDYEAQPKQRVELVDRGVVRNVVTDSYYSHKLGIGNTGHALPAPNAWGPQALNIVVAPGSATTQELIAQTKRGILVTRFWYIRPVDQKRAIVTGMTRDGTFLIESGKVTRGVRNMRFNQSIVEALANATFSNELTRTGGYSYSVVVPSAKIEGFRFTSGTDF